MEIFLQFSNVIVLSLYNMYAIVTKRCSVYVQLSQCQLQFVQSVVQLLCDPLWFGLAWVPDSSCSYVKEI